MQLLLTHGYAVAFRCRCFLMDGLRHDSVGGEMARTFSDDLQQRVLSAVGDGMAARSAASGVGSGASIAIGWIANGDAKLR